MSFFYYANYFSDDVILFKLKVANIEAVFLELGTTNVHYNSKRTDHDLMCGSCRYLIAVTVHQ